MESSSSSTSKTSGSLSTIRIFLFLKETSLVTIILPVKPRNCRKIILVSDRKPPAKTTARDVSRSKHQPSRGRLQAARRIVSTGQALDFLFFTRGCFPGWLAHPGPRSIRSSHGAKNFRGRSTFLQSASRYRSRTPALALPRQFPKHAGGFSDIFLYHISRVYRNQNADCVGIPS